MKKGWYIFFGISIPIIAILGTVTFSWMFKGTNFVYKETEYPDEQKQISLTWEGTYSIKEYRDVVNEVTYNNVLYLDCSLVNYKDETIRFINLNNVSVSDSGGDEVACQSYGCSEKLNILPEEKYTFSLMFVEGRYISDFFCI